LVGRNSRRPVARSPDQPSGGSNVPSRLTSDYQIVMINQILKPVLPLAVARWYGEDTDQGKRHSSPSLVGRNSRRPVARSPDQPSGGSNVPSRLTSDYQIVMINQILKPVLPLAVARWYGEDTDQGKRHSPPSLVGRNSRRPVARSPDQPSGGSNVPSRLTSDYQIVMINQILKPVLPLAVARWYGEDTYQGNRKGFA
jgi:hypothetical protein